MIAVVDYHKGNLKSVERGLVAVGGDARITDDADAIARASAIVLPGVGAFADAADTMRALGQMDAVRAAIDRGVPFLGICLGMHLLFEEGVEGAPQEDDEESTHNAQGLAVLPGVVTKMPPTDPQGTPCKVPHVGWNTVVPPTCRPVEPLDAAVSPGTRSSRDPGGSCTETPREKALSEGASPGRVSSEGASPEMVFPEGASLGGGSLEGASFGGTSPEARFASAVPRIPGVGEAPAGLGGSSGLECPIFASIEPGTYFYFTHSYIAPDTPATVAITQHSVAFPSAVQFRDAAFGVQFHPEKSSDAGATLLRNFVEFARSA